MWCAWTAARLQPGTWHNSRSRVRTVFWTVLRSASSGFHTSTKCAAILLRHSPGDIQRPAAFRAAEKASASSPATEAERRNAVADALLGLGDDGSNCLAKLIERGALLAFDGGEILI